MDKARYLPVAIVGVHFKVDMEDEADARRVETRVGDDKLCRLRDAIRRLPPGNMEVVLISTCHRLEAVVAGADLSNAKLNDVAAILGLAGVDGRPAKWNTRLGRDAVTHLFEVASGIDSVMIGETAVLGQVKQAYEASHGLGFTGKTLNKLFQESFRVAKHLRSTTNISKGKVSWCSIAISEAVKELVSLEEKQVLIVGAGGLATEIVRALSDMGVAKMSIANRTMAKAEKVATQCEAGNVAFEYRYEAMLTVDLVITATSAPDPVITVAELRNVMAKRAGRRILFSPLGATDLELGCSDVPGVVVIPRKRVEQVAMEATKHREEALPACRSYINKEAESFLRRYHDETASTAQPEPRFQSLRCASTGKHI